jgi:hypothetical protein
MLPERHSNVVTGFAENRHGVMRRIGVLMNVASDDPEAQARISAFRQELHQLVSRELLRPVELTVSVAATNRGSGSGKSPRGRQ